MKKILTIATVMATLAFTSCTTVLPLQATSNNLGSKVGEAKVTFVMGIPMTFNADLGVQKAAKEAGISKISTVDSKIQNYFLWSNVSTVVTGN